MRYKEFKRWANERASDGQWGMQQAIATIEIYDEMAKVKFFKEKYWKNNCEERANDIVRSVSEIKEKLKL